MDPNPDPNPDYDAIVDTFGHLIKKVNPGKTNEGLIDLASFFLCMGMYDEVKTCEIIEVVDSSFKIDINKIFIGACSKANIEKMIYLIHIGVDINHDNGRALYVLIWNKETLFKQGKNVDKYDRAINFLLENGIKIADNIGAVACLFLNEYVIDYILQIRNLTKIEMQILGIFKAGDIDDIHHKRAKLVQRLIDDCLIDPNILCESHFEQSFEKDKPINKYFLLLMQKNGVDFNYILDNLLKKN